MQLNFKSNTGKNTTLHCSLNTALSRLLLNSDQLVAILYKLGAGSINFQSIAHRCHENSPGRHSQANERSILQGLLIVIISFNCMLFIVLTLVYMVWNIFYILVTSTYGKQIGNSRLSKYCEIASKQAYSITMCMINCMYDLTLGSFTDWSKHSWQETIFNKI